MIGWGKIEAIITKNPPHSWNAVQRKKWIAFIIVFSFVRYMGAPDSLPH